MNNYSAQLSSKKARVIAFYLPQYHPIEENDQWWGKGFTEWTNVTKAKPLFPGHHQPNLPADLGFYDLRVPESRIAQAQLAQEYGIEGFCYWHYWFGHGKRLLERPLQEVLDSGEPDFPFCLAWANHSWTGIWLGSPDKILLEQTYPGKADYKAHFETVVKAFQDPRYLKVDGKPIFVVFAPYDLPNPREFTDYWQELSQEYGFPGIYFVGMSFSLSWDHRRDGFDAITTHPPKDVINRFNYQNRQSPLQKVRKIVQNNLKQFMGIPRRYNYQELIDYMIPSVTEEANFLPNIVPNWDNTPRSGSEGFVLLDSTPDNFKKALEKALSVVDNKKKEEKIIFVKAWNEWAEGNYLEPDRQWKTSYLEAVKSFLFEKS